MKSEKFSAVAFAALLSISFVGESYAGNGKGGGNGGGSERSSSSSGGGNKGGAKADGHPSELKKLNGVINANANALANANENSVHGKARTYRDATIEVDGIKVEIADLNTKKSELLTEQAGLASETSVEDYATLISSKQGEIGALNVDDFESEEAYNTAVGTLNDEITALETAQSSARTDAEIAARDGEITAELGTIDGEITALEGEIASLEAAAKSALDSLTGGRELSETAFGKFLSKLGLD